MSPRCIRSENLTSVESLGCFGMEDNRVGSDGSEGPGVLDGRVGSAGLLKGIDIVSGKSPFMSFKKSRFIVASSCVFLAAW